MKRKKGLSPKLCHKEVNISPSKLFKARSTSQGLIIVQKLWPVCLWWGGDVIIFMRHAVDLRDERMKLDH